MPAQKLSAPLRVTERVDYALKSVLFLCLRGDEFVTAEEIAQHHGFSVKMLAEVLRSLRAAGVLESRPGWHGGFRLGSPAHQIPLKTVIAATADDDLYSGPAPGGDIDSSPDSAADRVASFWQSLDSQIQNALTRLTVADLAA